MSTSNRLARSDGRPTLTVADHCDQRLRDSCNHGQCVCRHPLREQTPNVGDTLAGELGIRLQFTTEINKPDLPCVLRVSRKADPLKIFRSVIRLLAVDVIDCQVVSVTRNERDTHQAVKQNFDSFRADLDCHFEVARPRLTWADRTLWPLTFDYLFLAVSCALVLAGQRRHSHVAAV